MIIAHTWGQYGEWQVCPTTSRNTTNRAERILASREGTPPPGELYEQPSGPSPLTNISYADHLTHLYLEASRVALELRLLLVFFLWPRWPSSVFLGCSDSCWGVPGLGPQLSPPDLWASVSTEGLGPCLLFMFSAWGTHVSLALDDTVCRGLPNFCLQPVLSLWVTELYIHPSPWVFHVDV